MLLSYREFIAIGDNPCQKHWINVLKSHKLFFGRDRPFVELTSFSLQSQSMILECVSEVTGWLWVLQILVYVDKFHTRDGKL